MNPLYERRENEDKYEYGLRLIETKIVQNPQDLDWSAIVEALDLDIHPDSLRKAAATTEYCGFKVAQYFKRKYDVEKKPSNYMTELDMKQRELEKERKKLYTERLEYNRWLREDARDELFLERIIEAVKSTETDCSDITPITPEHNSKGYILCLADIHFGKDFKIYGLNNEVINEYSPEIFCARMETILSETVEYIERENVTELKVLGLGDELDGFLRNSQIWTLRYGVVESAIIFAKYMAEWLKTLSKHTVVEYHTVNGNHTSLRLLDGKKDEHLNENIADIVNEIIAIKNESNPNFSLVRNKTGLIYFTMQGYNILGIHGEVKNHAVAIKDFSDMYDKRIDILIAGHKHHGTFINCGYRKQAIGIGSIVGSDDYSMKLKKQADATANILTIEEGKGCVNNRIIVLN